MASTGYGGAVANNEWHYILTLNWQESDSSPVRLITAHGLYVTAGPMTRQDVFQEVLARARRGTGAPESAVVMFFALEPNTLTEA
ncbi:hypothetical protein [Nocardia fluminea]|uniref:hypothetical protein n=1 Tax=Nocardia fluminea TaxID=134984 RepID=UPI00366174B4